MQKLGAMGMLSEGKGFLTCGENEAGRPHGVVTRAWNARPRVKFMLWKTFNQMLMIVIVISTFSTIVGNCLP